MAAGFDKLGVTEPVIPVVVIEDKATAVDLARSLAAGGLEILEVTLRTGAALDSIRAIKESLPNMVIGAGTVNTNSQMQESVSAGADFLVSPGVTDRLLAEAQQAGIPWLPAATTPTEVLRLAEEGHTLQKFFPAEASGGTAWLKAVYAPIPEVSFCPTGGITPDNTSAYLSLPNVPFVGGTWLATREMIREGAWARIEELARQAVSIQP